MKKIILLGAALLALQTGLDAQNYKYEFTTVKANPVTKVKNQSRSGTCWAFSTISMVESEVIRINGIKDTLAYPDFSEMFVVSKSYMERAIKYVRVDGALGFSSGSEADDVLHVIRDYGLVPEEAMPGLQYGSATHNHSELDALTKAYVEAIAKNPGKKLSPAWRNGYQAILDTYLGKCPETFSVGGVSYTPATYRDKLKFNPDDYICITSFTHHPFYTWFPLEVCDNWRWDSAYNIPIDEFMEVLDNAINNGYTAAWGADVSLTGFSRTNGLAVLPDFSAMRGKRDQEEDSSQDFLVELEPTQESRQIAFDNKDLTDDHGMQIYGIATNQYGKQYYMVKNSWGETGPYNGIWYASRNFVKGMSLDLVVHKDALTRSLKKSLGIK